MIQLIGCALPYDVMNSEEAKEMVQGNEHSFLRIDRANQLRKCRIPLTQGLCRQEILMTWWNGSLHSG